MTGSQHLDAVLDALEEAGVAHAFVGAAARNAWTSPRLTTDTDFAVLADAEEFDRVVAALSRAGWQLAKANRADPDDPVPAVAIFRNASAPPPFSQVDLLVAGTEFEAQAVRGAVRRPLQGRPVPVVRREDLIVYKLIAWRSRDRGDAVEVLAAARATGEPLDLDHLRRWASVWGEGDKLERLLAGEYDDC